MKPSINRMIAITSGIVFVLIIGGMILVSVPDFIRFLDHWQTLSTGILSLCAASATVIYLRAQIEQQNRFERDKRIARYISSKIKLNRILSVTTDQLKDMFDQLSEGGFVDLKRENVKLISDQIQIEWADVIVQIPHSNVRNRMIKLLSSFQILNARSVGLIDDGTSYIAPDYNVKQQALSVVKLYCVTGSLFEYARSDVSYDDNFSIISVNWDYLMSHTFSLMKRNPDVLSLIDVERTRDETISFAKIDFS